jgi:hypothetical protein
MAATVLVTGSTPEEEMKKTKALSFMANNLSLQEITRLEEMARSAKARAMLNENWAMLQTFI